MCWFPACVDSRDVVHRTKGIGSWIYCGSVMTNRFLSCVTEFRS